MAVPLRMQAACLRYILGKRLSGAGRYPLVLMLEPLFACNLACPGCGKIQYPPDTLRRRMSPEECWEACEECAAPIVSLAGGEPLLHAEIGRIVSGLVRRGRFVYLCTNALLLESRLGLFRPSSQLVLSVHLDGQEEAHDRAVARPGAWRAAVSAIRRAKAEGFHVMTNTTVFAGSDPQALRGFFDFLMELGVDGMTLSPAFAYEKAAGQGSFLGREAAHGFFRALLADRRARGWDFNHSPFYLDFLEGRRAYDCTPWGNPMRCVLGWQRPCYLMEEGGYAKTYRELVEGTDFSRYGLRSKNPRCADCMTHVGFEPSAVLEAFSSPAKFLAMAGEVVFSKRRRP